MYNYFKGKKQNLQNIILNVQNVILLVYKHFINVGYYIEVNSGRGKIVKFLQLYIMNRKKNN